MRCEDTGKRYLIKLLGGQASMQKRVELKGVDCAILKLFADPMRFQKKLFKSAGLSANSIRKYLCAFMAWMHFTLLGKRL